MAALLVIALYLLPTIVAISRKMPNMGSTIVINVLLGWTFVGWIIALAMACGSQHRGQPQIIIQNNVAHGNVAGPNLHQPVAAWAPGPLTAPTWDAMRQAWVYWDEPHQVWLIHRGGQWAPLQTADFLPLQPPPPPPPPR